MPALAPLPFSALSRALQGVPVLSFLPFSVLWRALYGSLAFSDSPFSVLRRALYGSPALSALYEGPVRACLPFHLCLSLFDEGPCMAHLPFQLCLSAFCEERASGWSAWSKSNVCFWVTFQHMRHGIYHLSCSGCLAEMFIKRVVLSLGKVFTPCFVLETCVGAIGVLICWLLLLSFQSYSNFYVSVQLIHSFNFYVKYFFTIFEEQGMWPLRYICCCVEQASKPFYLCKLVTSSLTHSCQELCPVSV